MTHRLPLVLLLALGLTAPSCRGSDDATPVATPAISIGAQEVAVGRTVPVTYRFTIASDAPALTDDYVVFVHAFDARGTRMWTADHSPTPPTRQWKPGTVVEYTQPMKVPKQLQAGAFTLHVGLYSPKTGERLPLSGEAAGKREYKVGGLNVVASKDLPVIFADGWHDLEAPEDAQGVEWHWSTGSAGLWLRNPKRDITLVIELDQPAQAFSGPQQVTLRNGALVLGTFMLPPGVRQTQRLPVTASQLGDQPLARLTMAVDQTFVPAKLPSGGSTDTRVLGVRVFSVEVEETAQPAP